MRLDRLLMIDAAECSFASAVVMLEISIVSDFAFKSKAADSAAFNALSIDSVLRFFAEPSPQTIIFFALCLRSGKPCVFPASPLKLAWVRCCVIRPSQSLSRLASESSNLFFSRVNTHRASVLMSLNLRIEELYFIILTDFHFRLHNSVRDESCFD